MYSKILSLFCCILLASCSLRLNDEVEKPKINVNPLQSGCLANAGDVTARFLDGEIQEKELDEFWVCLEKAFHTFTENTRGRVQDRYEAKELGTFLTKYFLKDKVIEPALLHEAMLLKQAIVGGSARDITRQEIAQTLELIQVMRASTKKILPHMPLSVDSYRKRGYSQAQFEEAMETFQASMAEVARALEKTQGSYSFDRLAALLTEMKAFLYSDQPAEKNWIDRAVVLTSALRQAKSIFISPPADEILASDWSKIYDLGPRYFSLFLRTEFFARSKTKFAQKEGLDGLEKLFFEYVSLLELAMKNQPDGAIHSKDIEGLLSGLHEGGILPVSLDTSKSFARFLFVRLLNQSNTKEEYRVTPKSLDRLRETFLFGTEGLKAIEAIYRAELGENYMIHSLPLESIARHASKNLLSITEAKNAASLEAIEAVKNIAAKTKTIFPANSSTVYVPESRNQQNLSLAHISTLHLLYTANRLIFQSYGGPKAESLSEAEVVAAADDLFPILEELKLVTPDTRLSVPKRLFEASLFLPSSDGDTRITMTEALELEALLLSTVNRGGDIHAEIARSCGFSEVDVKTSPLIPSDCYREQFLKNLKKYWNYIPGLSKHVSGKNQKEQQAVFKQLENFLRKGRTNEHFNKGDTYSFVLLPYYVELLFSRFDQDKNGLLTNAEAELAFHVFKPFLAAKCAEHGLNSDEDHHAVYMFLLAYQTLPTDMKGTWIWRRYIVGNKNFKVDRSQVITIFEKLLSL